MYDRLRRWTLQILKVPPEPHPPFGDPASLRVFNAGRNYFRLRMVGWTITQALALAGFIFWTTLLIDVERQTALRQEAAQPTAAAATNPESSAAEKKPRRGRSQKQAWERIGKATVETTPGRKNKSFHPWNGFKQACIEVAALLPTGVFLLIWAVKILSFLLYVAQIPLTYAIRRIDYEMRWYMVTDRSLRLRSGVWRIAEATMSFANIQQVLVSQGPLQRLLGLADVQVKSAGGGGGDHHHQANDMHTGLFHCVTNAPEIRDLIIERLRRFREAGLGDPDEKEPPSPKKSPVSSHALKAAQELAAEAHALRAALS